MNRIVKSIWTDFVAGSTRLSDLSRLLETLLYWSKKSLYLLSCTMLRIEIERHVLDRKYYDDKKGTFNLENFEDAFLFGVLIQNSKHDMAFKWGPLFISGISLIRISEYIFVVTVYRRDCKSTHNKTAMIFENKPQIFFSGVIYIFVESHKIWDVKIQQCGFSFALALSMFIFNKISPWPWRVLLRKICLTLRIAYSSISFFLCVNSLSRLCRYSWQNFIQHTCEHIFEWS